MLQSRPQRRESQAEDAVNHTSDPEWQEIKTPSTLIGRRCCHASVLHQDTLYVHGGYDNNSTGIFADMFAFSLRDTVWTPITQHGQPPGPRHSHSAVLFGDAIFMFGGMVDVMSNTNALHRFDLTQNSWKKLEAKHAPAAIDSHKAVVWGDRMLVGMGYSEDQYNSKIYSLNLTTFEWKCVFNPKACKPAQYPKARAHGSFNLYNNAVYIYGGKDFNSIFNDLWRFDLETNKYAQVALVNAIPGRFSHSGVVSEGRLFIFGGTRGVAHERNDLIAIDLDHRLTHTLWQDSQEERLRAKEEHSPVVKKSRRDSAKKFGVEFYDSENHQVAKSNASPGKYRNRLKEANYYNELYENRKKQNETLKRTRRNPLLTEFEGAQDPESLNLTSTFEILTNSIMITMGKAQSREERGELNFDSFRRVPKARDNYSADLQPGDHPRLLVFGGGMHKVSYNDLILVDLRQAARHLPHSTA